MLRALRVLRVVRTSMVWLTVMLALALALVPAIKRLWLPLAVVLAQPTRLYSPMLRA
jgi:hypothetical protein